MSPAVNTGSNPQAPLAGATDGSSGTAAASFAPTCKNKNVLLVVSDCVGVISAVRLDWFLFACNYYLLVHCAFCMELFCFFYEVN